MVNRRHERLGIRYSKIFAVFAGVATVSSFLVLLAWQFFPTSSFRTTVLLVGNPMMVASWDGARKHVTVIRIPPTVSITGLNGVGEYSLESLWKLGDIDKNNRTLLSDSLGETLAIAIPWYIGLTDGDIKKVFSVANAPNMLMGRHPTNMPLSVFLPLALATQNFRTDAVDELTISDALLMKQERPDGSSISFLDPDTVDRMAGTQFEEETIRKESLRVAVKNTTPTPSLGRRMERRIARAGALVVEVGNDEQTIEECRVFGSKKNLKSYTATFLRQFYSCELLEGESKRADLDVRVGREFEKLFR